MKPVLDQLVEKLGKAYGDRLISVILYGSRAVGDHQEKFSDANILCVLREVTLRELGESAPVFQWWRQQGHPAPLLLSAEEVRTSTDCFPIEFHDIKARRRVLYGEDVVAQLEIDYSFHRAQVEHELRAKMLRLRQKAAGFLADRELLLRLMADSLSTFCVLMRHSLLLAGEEAPHGKREAIEGARVRFGIDPAPFLRLLELRDGAIKPRAVDPAALFGEYLNQIRVLIEAVDRLER